MFHPTVHGISKPVSVGCYLYDTLHSYSGKSTGVVGVYYFSRRSGIRKAAIIYFLYNTDVCTTINTGRKKEEFNLHYV